MPAPTRHDVARHRGRAAPAHRGPRPADQHSGYFRTTTPAPTTSAPAVVVVLKAIAFHGSTPYVVVSFSGKSIALKTGDTSAGNLKVVAIAPDDGTATFQLGDQTFDLHIGQSYVD